MQPGLLCTALLLGLKWAADGCREHAEGSLLWDVFYAPDMGAHPVAQMCMESAARQTTFSLQLASQLDQEEHLTITTLEFRFRYQAAAAALLVGFVLQVQILPPDLYKW